VATKSAEMDNLSAAGCDKDCVM